jgi:predicted dehydrogenase
VKASRKIGIGIIGLGWMGQIHAKLAVLIEGCALRGICDVDPRRLEQARLSFQVDGYSDYRALLERSDIEAIYLVTPPAVRYTILKDCVQAGKHILCEKPLAISVEELASIRSLLGTGKTRFMMCFPERFAVSFQGPRPWSTPAASGASTMSGPISAFP